MTPARSAPLELWAGPECTVNRVGDRYSDQTELTGHGARMDDLDRFAALGIRAIRYPVLWERTTPDGGDSADWSWPDERLARLRELGIRPVVGLVHHGSGPRDTSLVDPQFPEKLARYARAVAERYPWVDAWTPVNEPLTTARFSALYGLWYPHTNDNLTFCRALLNQCRGVVLAMREIRKVNPDAQLVQTDDLGKTHSTQRMHYQAAYENERRWAAWDLLCGRLRDRTTMHDWMRLVGIPEEDLAWFRDNPCPPDVVGVNHYLSSERFLDERLELYPNEIHGTNGYEWYADVHAPRVLGPGTDGPEMLLREAWERYRIPIAVTEAHNGCTREEQLRWLDEVWTAAQRLRGGGADVRAVTLWSLLGAFDWDGLLTQPRGHYEPGVFDLRAPEPRPTALAAMARGLAEESRWEHPVLATPGWWRRRERLWYEPHGDHSPGTPDDARPILVTGGRGTLGRALARVCAARGLAHRLVTRAEMDIADVATVERALAETDAWAVVNGAGYVRVDDAERDVERCFRENADGPAVLARACAAHGVQLVTFSSDLVFDGASGAKDGGYVESDPVAPLNVYGRSKAEGEARVLEAMPEALVVRTSAFFGPWDEYNFVTLALRALAAGIPFVAADDATVSPTYVPDLAHACLDLLIDGEHGIWHVASDSALTWAGLARAAAAAAGVDAASLEPCATADLDLAARRPNWSVLGSERGWILPTLDDALARYVRECDVGWRDVPAAAPARAK